VKPKIIVETNIIFSSILNPDSKIGRIIIGSRTHFQFYTCDFLKAELLKHKKKILKLTHLSTNELDELEFLLTKNITFINEELIPKQIIFETEDKLTEIDLNDTPFVALTKYLNGILWTGDKQLIAGLDSKKFIEIITTNQLSQLIDKLEQG
jgi:predicted nucleic acid-binding protein